ncbi:MAG: riboflavin biosynthesis protein RibF [Nitrospirae bacterium GWC1_57_7]|nr:MAG: riboflavin biosynthesis protein RibF [Nitrospirae bacterium GWC1_57_7]
MRLFEAACLDIVICANFTRAFADQNPEDFAKEILVKAIGAREVYVGYDYAFGKGREGSIEFLKKMGSAYGFQVGVIDAVSVEGAVVSSSRIRECVSGGRVDEAQRLLGRHYAIEGKVVTGARRGHTLGFPTANLQTANELLPDYGVYAVQAVIDGRQLNGVASVGVRPTFGGGPVSIEVYLFDLNEDLYGRHMEVAFVRRLRKEERFPDAGALIRQMQDDVAAAKKILLGLQGS